MSKWLTYLLMVNYLNVKSTANAQYSWHGLMKGVELQLLHSYCHTIYEHTVLLKNCPNLMGKHLICCLVVAKVWFSVSVPWKMRVANRSVLCIFLSWKPRTVQDVSKATLPRVGRFINDNWQHEVAGPDQTAHMFTALHPPFQSLLIGWCTSMDCGILRGQHPVQSSGFTYMGSCPNYWPCSIPPWTIIKVRVLQKSIPFFIFRCGLLLLECCQFGPLFEFHMVNNDEYSF